MIRKILKWTGLTLLTIILLAAVTIASRQNLKFDAPYPVIKASTDSAVIARGKQIVFGIGHCVECHGPKNFDSLLNAGQQVPLNGGRQFIAPIGILRVHNITSDKETGIGRLRDVDIARIVRYGVYPDGKASFMPTYDYNDDDLTAIVSYIRTQQPVKNKVPEHEINLMGNFAKAFFVKPADPARKIPDIIKRDSTAEYGKYLVLSVAKCAECHSKPDRQFGGGEPMGEVGEIAYTPPNISTDRSSSIYGWSQKNFIDRFRMGRIIPNSHMPWNAFKRAGENDLKAIYKFLQTVPPVKPDSVTKK